ncbi:hybrid sensor histidine kinase/response regulator [Alteromonas sp. CYL-A6]|uniref:hybrid sensor histidine kinase/response regulator n=1 Tax=Alteromonas nitratireducens TaxID=3390813 RepID=UPI0034BDFA4D
MTTRSSNHAVSTDALQARIEKLESQVAQAAVYREQSEYYQVLFHNMQHEVHVWELVYDGDRIKTWRLIDANEVALASWQREREHIIGKETDAIFGKGTTKLFMPIVEKIYAEQKPHTWESYFEATDQTLSMTSIPCDGYFISTGIDISDIRRTEKQLRETVLQLQEAIAAGNIGLWEWDLVTNKTYFSPEWKSQLGYQTHEIDNEFSEWEKRVHPDDLEDTLVKVRKTLAGDFDNYEAEFRMRHKDGTYRWILAHASLVQDETGEPVRLLGSHMDITERVRLEETALQQQKMQALGTLAGGIAHDFNNLLTPILGYAQLLKLKLAGDPSLSGYVSNLEDSANRAKALIKQILLMSRESVENIEPVYLDKLADEVVTLVQSTAHSNISIEENFEDGLPAIGANPSEIYRVILNLCTNAIQAMPDGGTLTVSVGMCDKRRLADKGGKKDDYVCLSIRDTGVGMDRETRNRIFEPFYTTKLKGEERGSGLGLSIVDSLIKQHKGHIEVLSSPGRGTEFILFFPIVPDGVRVKEHKDDAPDYFEHMQVVLVDDEAAICELGESLLEHIGCDVTSFQSAKEALAHMKENPDRYQVMITDYAMPEMNGLTLLHTLRENAISTPVIVATGYTNMATEENRQQWGCEGIVSKPFSIKELSQALSAVQKA